MNFLKSISKAVWAGLSALVAAGALTWVANLAHMIPATAPLWVQAVGSLAVGVVSFVATHQAPANQPKTSA